MPRTKRKDKSRVVLRTGESQRADGTYHFSWTDANHKRRYVYAKTLDELRYKEEQIAKDKSDVIKAEARYTTVNDIYELWKDLKRGLKNNIKVLVSGVCGYDWYGTSCWRGYRVKMVRY